MMKIDDKHIKIIKELCRQHNVSSFAAFGSVIRDDFNKESDVDFIVDFKEKDPFIYADLYFELKEKLENLLNRKVDLIEERAIKNQFFKKEVDKSKVNIYG